MDWTWGCEQLHTATSHPDIALRFFLCFISDFGWFDHVKATLVDIQTLPHDFDLYKVAPRYNLDYNHYQHLSTVVDLS